MPLIQMVRVVPYDLHQMMKLVWKDQELFIHSKDSHSGWQAPIIDDVSRGTDLCTVELVNSKSKDLSPQPPVPSMYKMIATMML